MNVVPVALFFELSISADNRTLIDDIFMMHIDESNNLLSNADKEKGPSAIVDICVNHAKPRTTLIMALCLALGNAADAVEITCVGFIMTEMERTDNISTFNKEFLSAAVFMGMLLGGVTCGFLSDMFGRKICLLASLFLNAAAGFASALSPNIDILIFCRVIGGIGIGGSVPSVFSLGAEIFPAASRGKYLSIIASFWMVGSIYTAFAAWIMLGDDFSGNKILPGVDWRAFAVVSALPALMALILTQLILPESPRFLLSKERYSEVAEVLKLLSGVNLDPHMLVENRSTNDQIDENSSHSIISMTHNPVSQASAPVSVSATGVTSSPTVHPTAQPVKDAEVAIIESVNTLFMGNVRRNTMLLLSVWFTLSFGSYGLSAWISTLYVDVGMVNAYADTFIYSLATLPGNLLTIALIDSIGRQRMLSWGMILAAVSVVGFAVDNSDVSVVLISSSLFNCFSVIGWNALDCLSCECFPTKVRTTAMGLLAASGRIGAISAQFVNGTLEGNIPLLLFVTCGCTVAGGLLAAMLPRDSSGVSLSNSDADGDGDADEKERRNSNSRST